MKIGLYFGSFNPIHKGHLDIAKSLSTFFEQIWFVVSPQSPFKKKTSLLNPYHRLFMVRLATEEEKYLKTIDIEFFMPKPNFTINTLQMLSDRYPHHKFDLIIGGDQLKSFHLWKEYKKIIENYHLIVYPRDSKEAFLSLKQKNIQILDAPLLQISSSLIREYIEKGVSMEEYLPQQVVKYIKIQKKYVF